MTTVAQLRTAAASTAVNALLSIQPLAQFAKQKARTMMIKRAESIGVPWTANAVDLAARGAETWEQERAKLEDPNLAIPDYYRRPFHAYDNGNLSWQAAMEVESAAYAAHASLWSKPGSVEGDARLRQGFHDIVKAHISPQPQAILDLGCSVGMSTQTLQDTFPEAQLTGVDLSIYFLTVAQYRHQAAAIHWLHSAAEAVPQPSASFDLVSSSLMFHELPQSATRAILQEARRLLKPGGWLAIMDMNPRSEAFLNMPPYVFTLLKSTEPYLDDYFTLDFEQAIADSGFRLTHVGHNSPRHRTFIAQVV